MNIPFSPPDISEAEINEVAEALRSGWITTGPRVKLLERRLAAYIETGRTDIDCNTDENAAKYSNKVVCLNSATASEELNFRICGIGEGDEVIGQTKIGKLAVCLLVLTHFAKDYGGRFPQLM